MSISHLLRGLFLLIGVVGASVAAYFATQPDPTDPPAIVEAQPPAGDDGAAEMPDTGDAPAGDDGAPDTPDTGDDQAAADAPADTPAAPADPVMGAAMAPELDIVRVEPDGSMVIAGRAGPGNEIDIIVDGKVVETLKADASGEFATVLTGSLAKGSHALSLVARGAGGVAEAGKQQVAIEIVGDGQAPLVVVQDDVKPPQLVQVPEPAAPADGGEQQVAAAPEPAEPQQPDAPAADTPVADQPAADQPAADAPAAQAPAEGEPAVYIRAFEVSPADANGINELALVGEAPAGAVLRIYVDDDLAGDTKADASGRWALKVRKALPPGRHTVRADMLGDGNADVIARAQVRFDRVELIAADEPPAGQQPQAPAEAPPALAEAPAPAAPADGSGGTDAGTGTDTDTGAGTDAGTDAGSGNDAGTGDTAVAPQPAPQAPADDDNQQVVAAPPAPAAPPSPAQPAEPAAPPSAQQPGDAASRVEIKRGDALWRIAREIYGQGIQYTLIFDANRNQIDDPDLIFPGQVFTIPVVE